MVATGSNRRIRVNRRVRRPRETWRYTIPGVRIATEQEGKAIFDYRARKELGISGDEFLARWHAGEYRGITDWDEIRKVERLWMLIPLPAVRQPREAARGVLATLRSIVDCVTTVQLSATPGGFDPGVKLCSRLRNR